MEGNGLDDLDVHDIAIDPDEPQRIFATIEYDVRLSEDNGESWVNLAGEGKKMPMPYTRCVKLLVPSPQRGRPLPAFSP